MWEKYRIILKTLTPIHIGCGEAFQPLEFYVVKEKLYELDTDRFLENLSSEELKEYFKIFEKKDIGIVIELFSFTQKTFSNLLNRLANKDKKEILKLIKSQIKIPKYFKKDFEDVINNKVRINKFSIEKTFKNIKGKPYIPGSSLKGSIRTAVLNYLNRSQKVKKENLKNKKSSLEAEGKILNCYNEKEDNTYNISEDPFKFVKISDLHLKNKSQVATQIYYGLNFHKERKKCGIPTYLECILCGEEFTGEFQIVKNNLLNFDIIIKALKEFYNKDFEKEKQLLQRLEKLYSFILPEELINYSTNDKPLIRLGKHSGNEFVTIKNLRRLLNTKTIWLASETKKINSNSKVYPFGWTEISFEKI